MSQQQSGRGSTRSILGAALAAVLAVAGVLPATAQAARGHAKAPRGHVQTFYLDVFGSDCQRGHWAISRDRNGSMDCAVLNRAAVQGTGVNSADTPFESDFGGRDARLRLHSGRSVTGVFYVLAPGINAQSPALAGPYDVTWTVRLDNAIIGTVHLSGVTTPQAPASASFALEVPRRLDGKRLTSLTVSTRWNTCVVFCTTGTYGDHHSRISVRAG